MTKQEFIEHAKHLSKTGDPFSYLCNRSCISSECPYFSGNISDGFCSLSGKSESLTSDPNVLRRIRNKKIREIVRFEENMKQW